MLHQPSSAVGPPTERMLLLLVTDCTLTLLGPHRVHAPSADHRLRACLVSPPQSACSFWSQTAHSPCYLKGGSQAC